MAYTYATLTTTIRDYTEVDDSVFTQAVIDNFIMQAEHRINIELPMDSDRFVQEGTLSTDNNTINSPAGALFIRGVEVFNSTTNSTGTGTWLEKKDQTYLSEYTGGNRTNNIFNVVARGTSAPYRGVSPEKTTASSHPIGAKVYGSRPVTMIQTTSVNDANTTVTEENSYLVPALVIGLAFLTDTFLAGGGLQCTYGPINDRA